MYQNRLSQTADHPKYLLAVNVDKIIKDESSVKDEREYFDNELENLNADAEKIIREKEEELFGKTVFDIKKSPEETIIKKDNINIKTIK